jgi:hypothetical protein
VTDDRPKRPGTRDDRDRYIPKGRTAPHGLPVVVASATPVAIEDEDSAAIEDPAVRRAVRRRRDTEDRVEHAEDRLDDLAKVVTQLVGILGAREEEARIVRRRMWRLFFKVATPVLTALASAITTYLVTR